MTEEDLDRMLAEFAIDGLEAHYRSYTDVQTARYREMAERRGLLISCGSDSHAPKQPVDPRPWRACWCAALLTRLGVAVRPTTDPVWQPGMDRFAAPLAPAAPDGSSESVENVSAKGEEALAGAGAKQEGN